MKYHLITESEVASLHKLMQVFAAAFEDVETYVSKPPTTTYLKNLLQNPTNIVIVATAANDEIVGGLIAYELQKFEQEWSEIYLYDLAVAESYRRQGIATQLITELKLIAKKRGAKAIFVQADNIDTPAIALYTGLASGIESEVTHFDITV